MPLFIYRALDAQLQIKTGRLLMANRRQCHAELAAQKLVPVSIARQWQVRQRPLSIRAQAEYCRGLHELLEAGIPLLEALQQHAQASVFRTIRPRLSALAQQLAEGHTLTQGMQIDGGFPPTLIALVQAGERTGRLSICLDQYAAYLDWFIQLHQETRNRLLYPVFSAAGIIAASIFLATHLLPSLRLMLDPRELPATTLTLIWLVDALSEHGLVTLLALVSLYLLHRTYRRVSADYRNMLARWHLRIPVLGPWILVSQLAQYARVLALVFAQGVPILEALQIARQTVQQPCLTACLAEVERRVAVGTGLSEAFRASESRSARWPHLWHRLLVQGEKTGDLATALFQASEQMQRQSQRTQAALHNLLQPTTTLLSASLLAWIALACFGPLYAQLGKGFS